MMSTPGDLLSTSNLYEPAKFRILHYIDLWMASGGHSSPGWLVTLLEQRLCDYHQSDHCVAMSTGFWSLVASLRLAALEGPEVIIPSFTYRRLADVVFWAGKVPRFVDVDPQTLAISPSEVERAIGPGTGAILAVHPIVNCCDVTRLLGIAEGHSVPIIFDAVESVHETWEGKRIGSFDAPEVFSFHASKLINGLEGGYVCSSDSVFADQLRGFRSQDSVHARQLRHGHWLASEMPDLHAAFALAGLDEIETNVGHNLRIYRAYERELGDVTGLRLVAFDETQQTSYKNIVAEVSGGGKCSRDQLVQRLNQSGILARAHYSPPLHSKTYEYSISCPRALPVTDNVASRFINLPCGHRVSESDVVRLVGMIKQILFTADENSDGDL